MENEEKSHMGIMDKISIVFMIIITMLFVFKGYQDRLLNSQIKKLDERVEILESVVLEYIFEYGK